MQSSMRKLLGKPTPASSNSSSPAHLRSSDGSKDDGGHGRHHASGGSNGDSKSQGGGSGRPSTSPVPLLYHPTAPQEASFQVGVPIAALDKSPDGQSSILAGRHVLKSVRVDGLDVKEAFDLRALITAQAAPRANSTVSIAEQLSIRDVKWGRGRNDVHIFTACLRGKIFQYDLSRLGARTSSTTVGSGTGSDNIDFIQMQEDTRQINTLDINPSHDVFLLSGSQDGFVRLFDTRKLVADHRLGTTFKHMQGFKCNADVRHVQWSPRDGFFFACCTEQGMVLKWDIRKGNAPLQRITAHEKACASISWHPDGEHLISGGVDKACHVWDMTKTADKRQKPKYTLYTPASVAAVAWRPGQWSATLEGMRAAQVAVSYDVSGSKRAGINAVHVWDLARPTIPYKTIERFECSPSALLWKDQEFLWTAGEDGLFCQNDVTFAPRVIDRTAVSTLSFSPCGDVLTFLDERPPQPKAKKLASVHKDMPSATAAAASAVSSSAYGAGGSSDHASHYRKLVISRSDSEDDVVRSFLMPRRRRAGARKRRASSVPNMASNSTPPSSNQSRDTNASPNNHSTNGNSGNSNSGNSTARQIQNQTNSNNNNNLTVSLDKALKATGTFRPQQIMAIGHIPSAARKDTYGYLARIYLETLEHGLPPVRRDGELVSLPERVADILEQYARAAELVSQFRLAQVWRIISFAMDLLFRRRGLYHRQKRLEGPKKALSTTTSAEAQRRGGQKSGIQADKTIPKSTAEDDGEITGTVRKKSTLSSSSNGDHGTATSSRTLPVRSLLTEEIESTSNMPTPLARPVSGMAYLGEHFQGGASSGYEFQTQTSTSYGSAGGDAPSDIESLNLPPAQYKAYLSNQPRRRHLDSMPLSEVSQASHSSEKSHMSSVEGYDFYDTEAMAHAIDVPGASKGTSSKGAPNPPPVPFTNDARNTQNSQESQLSLASKLSDSPIRTPDFHRQDSTDSAAMRIFEISQASDGNALDDDNSHDHERDRHRIGGSSLNTTATSLSSRDREDGGQDARGVSRGRQPEHDEKQEQQAQLASSVGSTRLLRLNKALMSMDWSGSDLTMSATAPRDTYYRNASQDTESSSNSFTKRQSGKPTPAAGSYSSANNGTPFNNKRPILQRSASSRLDAMSVATSELLPMEEEYEDAEDKDDKEGEKEGKEGKDAAVQDRITDRDYLPWPHDPPFPYPVQGVPTSGFDYNSALNPYAIISRALSHEVRTSPLNASAMILLLKPLVPDDVIDPLQARAILRQHLSRLMGMKLFLEAALLRKLCVPGWPARKMSQMPGDDAPSGIELSKWGATGTTELGGVAAYTVITAPAQKNVIASYLCVTCKKPRDIEHDLSKLKAGTSSCTDDSVWKCGRCLSVVAPCAVCGHRDVSALAPLDQETDGGDDSSSVLSTWWYCVGCAHGGHLTCLEGWHSSAGGFASSNRIPDSGTGTEFSDGCCPLDGCGHACLPGQWRTETSVQRSDDLSRSLLSNSSFLSASSAAGREGGGAREGGGRNDIRPDGHDVGQSRAVDMVRENLGVLGTSPGRASILSGFGGLGGFGGGEARSSQTSQGRDSQGHGHFGGEPRERERRKSVKFAGTDGL
ncbi:wd repeat-containing protein [Ophiostoma piceae UAMH 11346]|uniref:Wd repeat-containing protein n=1 Tax=Ophiostoma piceae (strain UAMH 11346) TaxID=1262450 RepID=S3CT08_OPHP1|nr:wd repeat-containing protein [Ophiostoma piceae UAMH 11346]